jgi:hypothetical protein
MTYRDVPPKLVTFSEKIIKGPLFPKFEKYGCLTSQNFQNFLQTPKNLEKWVYILRKSLEMGAIFGQNDPQKRVRVLWPGSHIPVTFIFI